MDDLAHELPLNHRKRKATNDERSATPETQDTRARVATEGLLVDTSAVANSRPSVMASCLPWLAGTDAAWPSPTSPSSSSPVSPDSEYDTYPANPTKRPRLSTASPRPSNSTQESCKVSLARAPDDIIVDIKADHPIPSSSRNFGSHTENKIIRGATYIDYSSPHVPSLKPPINRQTLQELELDSIIQNPQLRHDMLVEPRLQFRPTHSRRKREAAEKYWAALLHELEHGCTCITLDCEGNDPLKLNSQKQSTQAAYICSIFDPALIEQEIKRGVFDPSGLLEAVGYVLKDHCAPMRDGAVDEMIQTAKICVAGGKMCVVDALRAFRMCMELFEIMKLDIANHQLQCLRPYLARTCGQYELQAFQNTMRLEGGLKGARTWLGKNRDALLLQQQTQTHRSRPPEIQFYSKLSTNQQVHLAALMGFVDLIFTPHIDPTNETPSPSDQLPTTYPETLYLDAKRLTALSLEAADLTALYLSLLLYRQLAQSRSEAGSERRSPSLSCLQKLKEELRAIAGNRLVYCFFRCPIGKMNTRDKRVDKWINLREDITLQIVKHTHARHMWKPDDQVKHNDSLDAQLVSVARNWVADNFHPDSPVSALARDRLRSIVLDAVIRAVCPKLNNNTRKFTGFHVRFGEDHVTRDAGTEPLMDEICALGHKITRLASVHLGTYLPLYEQEGFLNP
ncbi:T-complex protein 11 domain containing protein [Amanita muscaria]